LQHINGQQQQQRQQQQQQQVLMEQGRENVRDEDNDAGVTFAGGCTPAVASKDVSHHIMNDND